MILIADDDKTRLSLVKGTLQSENIQTKIVESGFALTVALYVDSPKILLIDSSIEWLNVFDFISEALSASKFPSTTFICIIENDNLEYINIAKENNIKYITSPIRVNDFIQIIRKYI